MKENTFLKKHLEHTSKKMCSIILMCILGRHIPFKKNDMMIQQHILSWNFPSSHFI